MTCRKMVARCWENGDGAGIVLRKRTTRLGNYLENDSPATLGLGNEEKASK